MKGIWKKIAMLTAAVLLLCLCGGIALAEDGEATAPERAGLQYDFNGAYGRDTADVVLLLRKIDGLQDEGMADAVADVNGNGKVNVFDAVLLLQMLLEDEFSMDEALKIVTYNIKCGWYNSGKTLDTIAQMLIDTDADIIGLQEVDLNTNRSSESGNQMEYLANKINAHLEEKGSEYRYQYHFTPVIQLGGDKTVAADPNLSKQAYGHGILSRHKIESAEILWPEAQQAGEEIRAITRYEIDVNDKTVAFYNCHLNGAVGTQQYKEIQDNYMAKDQYAVFVGDMNTRVDPLKTVLNTDRFELLTDTVHIDHIIVSNDTISWYADEKGVTSTTVASYTVPEFTYDDKIRNTASDHDLQFAYIELKD